ncbi:MAG: hypothetical protein ACOVQN_00490 [Exiguobacterium sp.]
MKKIIITDNEGRESHELNTALELYMPLAIQDLEQSLANAIQNMENAFALISSVQTKPEKDKYQVLFDRAKDLAEHAVPLIALRDRMHRVLLRQPALPGPKIAL